MTSHNLKILTTTRIIDNIYQQYSLIYYVPYQRMQSCRGKLRWGWCQVT